MEASTTPPVRVIHADAESILPGVTRPEREATLSVPFDAIIARVLITEGQRVRAGDVMVVLDDRVSRAAAGVSELQSTHTASVARARAVLDRAESAFARAKEALDRGASNDDALEEAKNRRDLAAADLRFAEERLEQAAAQLELARAQLDEHNIRAPFAGVVSRTPATAGEAVSPGEPIAELVSVDRALADLHLPAREALNLRRGESVALYLDEPIGAVVAGRIRFIDPRIDPVARSCRVVFDLDAPAGSIPGGVTVSLGERAPSAADLDRLETVAALRSGTRETAEAFAGAGDRVDPAE